MTREERIEKLRHLITCMKCEVSGKSCDSNCPTQYNAGNMGEIIENLEEIAKALEQEPCDDYISRQAVLYGLASIAKAKAKSDAQKSLMGRVMFFTEHLPSVTPQPKTGHWIKTKEQNDAEPLILWECSECLTVQRLKTNYCPNCGTKMTKSEE